ncbi:hypothetical protein ACFQ0M_14560 [Kitasatospora aburaviensis]
MDGFSMPQESCERTVAADGSALVVDKLKDRNSDDHREWRATWAAPDGRRVMIIEHNGQPATPNRQSPPLDAEQLRALVTAPAWGGSSTPCRRGRTRPSRRRPSPARRRRSCWRRSSRCSRRAPCRRGRTAGTARTSR